MAKKEKVVENVVEETPKEEVKEEVKKVVEEVKPKEVKKSLGFGTDTMRTLNIVCGRKHGSYKEFQQAVRYAIRGEDRDGVLKLLGSCKSVDEFKKSLK